MTPPRFPRRRRHADDDEPTIADAIRAIPDPHWAAQSIGVVAVKQHGTDTEPVARVAARAAVPDCAIIVRTGDGTHGLMCGLCLWRRHADPEALSFAGLRASAHRAGWRLDGFGNWCCQACQMSRAYHPARPVIHFHPDGHRARGRVIRGDDGQLRDAALMARSVAEHDLLCDVRDAVTRGRHHRTPAGAR